MAFLQQDAKVYVASGGVAATEVVAVGRRIARLNGQISIDLTWEFATARWRTRAIQDHDAFAIDGSITAEEVEWVASQIQHIASNVSVGSMALYGTALTSNSNTTANFYRITTSTIPKAMQYVFQFRRTDDGKLMQIYAPKAKLESYPMMFAGEDHTKHSLTWRLLASTNGKFIEVLHAANTAGAPG